ncbi:MAG: hypothetical protein ACYTFX_06260 [Planctomycetota bacterium]|jgi:hypothetical protein
MATPVLIDLSNYADLLVQSSIGRAGTPNGNIFFDQTNGTLEFLTATDIANIDLHSVAGVAATTGAVTIDADISGTLTLSTGTWKETHGIWKVGAAISISGYVDTDINGANTIASVEGAVLTVGDTTGWSTESGTGDETVVSTTEANPLTAALGIKLEAAYAFENQERVSDEVLRQYDRYLKGSFKFAGAYEFILSRKPATDADREILRGSGWTEFATDGGIDRIYFGNKGLSNIESGSQPYYMLSSTASPDLNTITPVDYAKAGQIDEAVQVYGDKQNTPSDTTAYSGSVATAASQTITVVAAAGTFTRSAGSYLTDGFEPGHRFTPTGSVGNTGIYTVDTVTALVITIKEDEWSSLSDDTGGGDEQLTVNGFDTRSYQVVSLRTYGQNYDRKETTTDLGIAELGPYSTGYALNESAHLTTVPATYPLADVYGGAQVAPWTSMTLEKLAVPQTETGFNEADGDFTWVLNNTAPGNLDQCVAFLDALSQTDDDIDSGAQSDTKGKRVGTWYDYTAAGLVRTNSPFAGEGLFLEQIPTADEQRVVFVDDAGGTKTRPFLVSLNVTVGATAVADPLAWYHAFFLDGPAAADFNTAGALTVQNASAVDIKGNVATDHTSNVIIDTFDYDGDTIGGTAGTDKDVVFLCEGDGGAAQAKTIFTITRQTTVAATCSPVAETNV